MTDTSKTPVGKANTGYWRSIKDYAQQAAGRDAASAGPDAGREFPEGAAELALDGVSRRKFLGLMGASTALAGAGLSGCIRKPRELVMPFAQRPEDLVPGRPMFYATAFQLGTSVQGLVVEASDGRPTKIEGNPQHPHSLGAASVFAQASVLDLYDPDRSQAPRQGAGDDAKTITWDEAYAAFDQVLARARAAGGAGVAVVIDTVMSPSYRATLDLLEQGMPNARLYHSDPAFPAARVAGAAMAGAAGRQALYRLENADTILVLDADLFGRDGDLVRYGKGFARGRKIDLSPDKMNRLYVAEPTFTATGAKADHRLRVAGSDVGNVARLVAAELLGGGAPAGAQGVAGALGTPTVAEPALAFARAVAKDLRAAGTRGLVVAGDRQPAWVHALAHLMNQSLGSTGTAETWHSVTTLPEAEDLAALAQAIDTGSVQTVVFLGTNPVYTAPGELDLATKLGKVPDRIHAGLYVDETARLSTLHLPVSHYLESWGDLRTVDGITSIVQPLIAPLYFTPSLLEVAARAAAGRAINGYDLVREYWTRRSGGAVNDKAWRRWLHSGIVPADAAGEAQGQPPAFNWSGLQTALAAAPPTPSAAGDTFELNLYVDPTVFDGRFANNAWLQETPDPMTKLTWDNALHMHPTDASRLGLGLGGMVSLTAGQRSLDVAVFPDPGQAPGTVALNLGYGRKNVGAVASKDGEWGGFDAYSVRPVAAPWIVPGVAIKATGAEYKLASTQDYGRLEPAPGWETRPIVRELTAASYKENPNQVDEAQFAIIKEDQLKSLWEEPPYTYPQQWGMSIDLTACVGCNACLVACVAENNIPVVGKDEVLNGREMHWLRIDRYYTGQDWDNPQAVTQPMLCQHCENAPCESVCPVAATAHSPDGLNDMAYNRCIGTRYCSNNCPYKVRRFNFFNYNLDLPVTVQMQKNPNVTVRFRGVMEKCTYCVQRIQEAKIQAKVAGTGIVPDGGIVTACQQTCPTDAIVFGDVADPNSRVSKLKAIPLDYAVLVDLNTQPRTSYLAQLRNPNPDLV